MRGNSTGDLRLTQSEVARQLGVDAQVLTKWKREGLLVPTLDVPEDETRRAGNKHIYALRDLVAAEFANTTLRYLKINGAPLREMVRLVQTADEERLGRAIIVTLRTSSGMVRHIWIADLDIPMFGAESLGGPDHFSSGREFISHFEREKRVVSQATLKQIASAILKEFQKKFDCEFLAAQPGRES